MDTHLWFTYLKVRGHRPTPRPNSLGNEKPHATWTSRRTTPSLTGYSAGSPLLLGLLRETRLRQLPRSAQEASSLPLHDFPTVTLALKLGAHTLGGAAPRDGSAHIVVESTKEVAWPLPIFDFAPVRRLERHCLGHSETPLGVRRQPCCLASRAHCLSRRCHRWRNPAQA